METDYTQQKIQYTSTNYHVYYFYLQIVPAK